MEPKKNPQLELKSSTDLYFAIGLTLVMLLTYVVLEWKTYYVNDWDTSRLDIPNDLIEEVPLTIQKLPPPPPPKILAPPIIEIVPDDPDIIETPIEPNFETEIIAVSDVHVAEEEEEPILIDVIEEVPIFPGCENAKDKRACFQEKIMKHVRKTFSYPEPAIEMKLQGRVTTQFIIDKEGYIIDLKLHGPDELLKLEAKRIVYKLPQMIPGKQNGKAVKVAFTLPITFQLK